MDALTLKRIGSRAEALGQTPNVGVMVIFNMTWWFGTPCGARQPWMTTEGRVAGRIIFSGISSPNSSALKAADDGFISIASSIELVPSHR